MSRDRERARRAGYRQGWYDAMQSLGIGCSLPIEIPPAPYDDQHAADRQAADTQSDS